MNLTSNVFVAFHSEKLCQKVVAMLKMSGIHPNFTATSSNELLSKIMSYESGVILCETKLKDTVLFDILDYIPSYFHIVAIGTMDALDDLPNQGVFKLSVPLDRNDLIYSVTMLINLDNHGALVHNQFRTPDEELIIQQAKALLIHKYHMTEEQAHRYMQTKSMNSGEKMITIARLILN